jgi:hypothetical protein
MPFCAKQARSATKCPRGPLGLVVDVLAELVLVLVVLLLEEPPQAVKDRQASATSRALAGINGRRLRVWL